MTPETIALILTWVGIIAGSLIVIALFYTSIPNKTILGLDRTEFVSLLYTTCLLMLIATIFDFNKNTVFTFNCWLIAAIIWDKIDRGEQ